MDRIELRVRPTLPTRLLEHLLVLVLAHLLAPLLDYRTQRISRACVIDGLEKPGRRLAAPNHTVQGFCRVGGGRRAAPPVAAATHGARRTGRQIGPRISADALHGRARGASPPYPALPGEGGGAPPRGLGGDDLPGRHHEALRGGWPARAPLSGRVRRPGGRLLLGRGPLRRDGPSALPKPRYGGGTPR